MAEAKNKSYQIFPSIQLPEQNALAYSWIKKALFSMEIFAMMNRGRKEAQCTNIIFYLPIFIYVFKLTLYIFFTEVALCADLFLRKH